MHASYSLTTAVVEIKNDGRSYSHIITEGKIANTPFC